MKESRRRRNVVLPVRGILLFLALFLSNTCSSTPINDNCVIYIHRAFFWSTVESCLAATPLIVGHLIITAKAQSDIFLLKEPLMA